MVDIRKTITNISNLPTLPDVVTKINQLVRDPKTSAADINDAISRDMALSAKVLKLVNSPFYGFPRRISTVTHAVVILGFNAIRNLALSAFMFDSFKQKSKLFDLHGFWRHSIGVGIASQVIAKRIHFEALDDCFMAGLLHDVGKALMNQYFSKDFEKVVSEVESQDCLFRDAEQRLLGYDHAEVGGFLMERWNLPPAMVEVVSLHHTPEKSEIDQPICAIVHAADILVRALCVGYAGDRQIPDLHDEAWEKLKLTPNDLPALIEQSVSEIGRGAAFFDMT